MKLTRRPKILCHFGLALTFHRAKGTGILPGKYVSNKLALYSVLTECNLALKWGNRKAGLETGHLFEPR